MPTPICFRADEGVLVRVAPTAAQPSWYDECDTKRCTSTSFGGKLPRWAGSTFRPEECYYKLYEMEGIRSMLQGRWLVVNGGSNAILSVIAWGNVLDPVCFHPHVCSKALQS
eukprot:604151-Rhodomonas_salina.6